MSSLFHLHLFRVLDVVLLTKILQSLTVISLPTTLLLGIIDFHTDDGYDEGYNYKGPIPLEE